MNSTKLNTALGIIALLGGLVLIFSGQTIMGISGAVVGAIVAISSITTMKDTNDK